MEGERAVKKHWFTSTLVFLLTLALTLVPYRIRNSRDSEFSLVPVAYDAEEQILSGELFVELGWKHRGANAVSVDAESFVMNEVELQLVEGNLYVAPVKLSIGETGLYRIHVLQGQEVMDIVYEGNGIYDLLPIQRGSWGGTKPEYEDGVLNLHDNMQIDTVDSERNGCSVEEPFFHVYKNGDLFGSWKAEDKGGTYRISAESNILLECETGDAVRATFTCVDGYGISYEFTLYDYVITEDGLKENSYDTNPTLS